MHCKTQNTGIAEPARHKHTMATGSGILQSEKGCVQSFCSCIGEKGLTEDRP